MPLLGMMIGTAPIVLAKSKTDFFFSKANVGRKMSVWEVWFITVYIALNTENVIVSLVFKLFILI